MIIVDSDMNIEIPIPPTKSKNKKHWPRHMCKDFSSMEERHGVVIGKLVAVEINV